MMNRFSLPLACALIASSSPNVNAQTTTSRRGEETPIAVSPMEVNETTDATRTLATTRAELPPIRARSEDLSDIFAGLHIATSGAHSFNDTISLRGLSNTPIFGAPAVAVYLDEIPLLGAASLPAELAGLAGASLHRGPAESSRFGYAGPAGVLQLHSPTATRAATGSLRATVGDFSLRAATLAGTVAAAGETSVFASVSGHTRDGTIINRQLGHDVNHRDARSGLLRVETHPFAPLTLALTVHATRSRDGEQPLVPLDGPYFEIERASDGFTDHEALNAGLTASVDTAAGRLTATVALNDWQLGPYRSVLAFGPAELVNDAALSRRNHTLELRFATPLDAVTGWSVTGFAARAETEGGFARAFSGFVFEQSSYEIADRPLALGADAWRRLTPHLKLTAGLRAERNDQDFFRREQIPTGATTALSARDSALLPRVELLHEIDAHTAWSLSAAAGRKPGGFSAFTGNRALAAFRPERTRALESSLSRTFPAQRLRTTVRAYAYAISDYQIERSFATGAFTDDYLVVNAPRARSLGGEWETTWRATDALTLRADLGVSRVKLREFTDPYSKVRYDGRRAPFAPAHDASLGASYAWRSGFEASLSVVSTGRVYYTEGEEPRYSQRAVTRVNAGLGYRARWWRAQLSASNLGDREYYSSITPGTGHGTPGDPRMVTFTVEVFAPAN